MPRTFVSILGRRRRGGGPSLEEASVSALMQEPERAAERFANTGWAKALGDDDLQTGDLQSMVQVLAPDVLLVSDGGGSAAAVPRPIHTAEPIVRGL